MNKIIERLKNTEHKPTIRYEKKGASSILIPLIEKDGELHILFEVRSKNIPQPLEVCFPGGRLEKHEPRKKAAIREVSEELLVEEDSIEIIASLNAHMSAKQRAVWPFVGMIHDYKYTYSKDEVDHVFIVPLSYFLEQEPETHTLTYSVTPSDDFPYELINGGKDYPFIPFTRELKFYSINGEVIWGLTAEIVYNFIEYLKSLDV